MSKPSLAITIGDPLGIGPEVTVKALPRLRRDAELVVFGHRGFLERAAALAQVKIAKDLRIEEPPGIRFGGPWSKRRCGETALAYLAAAVDAVQRGNCAALVTGPICKEHIRAAGCPYPGHTELLAASAGVRETFLMMVGPKLRVTLVTLHTALKDVPAQVTRPHVQRAIDLTAETLKRRFGIYHPRLAVAGLNPHAGEGGLFGREESKIIRPAVQRCQRRGIQVTGPLPPDTVFWQAVHGAFDAVVSLYHDQGLIPVKLLHFDTAVNMTLGLPFVRTSVDHGTAFDIAWRNKANPMSLIAAGKLAAKLTRR